MFPKKNKTQFNHVNDKNRNTLLDPKDIAQHWKEYIEKLYQGEELQGIHKTQ